MADAPQGGKKSERGVFMKEYMIQNLDTTIFPPDGNPVGWVKATGTDVYTDWVECACMYTQTKIANPNNKYRIVSRNVEEWEECYR